jgi:DNA-directed RNA polymerase specialized sigma24 family protein
MPGDDPPACSDDIVAICRRRVQDFQQLSTQDQRDAVQQAVAKILDALQRGAVSNLPAYARRVAYHCAVDAWRRARAATDTLEFDDQRADEHLADAPADAFLPPTPEYLAREKQRLERLSSVSEDLRTLLSSAPDNYRHVLVRLYLESRTFEDLVDEEISHRIAAGDVSPSNVHDPVERQRARNTVHAWHSRALRWLQQRAPDAWREVIP